MNTELESAEVFDAVTLDFEAVCEAVCDEELLFVLLLFVLLLHAAREADNSVIIAIAEILFNIILSSFEDVFNCLYLLL